MELYVKLKDSKLAYYDELLSSFGKVWQKNKRDITITSLLNEGKKIEFSVDINSTHSYIFIYCKNGYYTVSKMIFILKDNHVLSLKLKINNIVRHKLIENVEVDQYMENGNIKYFFIDDDK